jgi:predicted nuclease of predicted toxin-antitoxin system
MKLLIDQNISHRIIRQIVGYFPDALHVKDIGLMEKNDYQIFMTAREAGFDAAITLDADFHTLWQQFGTPPKIIWLRTGNCSTVFLADLLIRQAEQIRNFLASSEHDCLEILV